MGMGSWVGREEVEGRRGEEEGEGGRGFTWGRGGQVGDVCTSRGTQWWPPFLPLPVHFNFLKLH